MNLKTLNDIIPITVETHKQGLGKAFRVYDDKIRKEAIKWVKKARSIKQELEEQDFISFHNITEEDLE